MKKLRNIDKEKIKEFFIKNKKICLISIFLIFSFVFIIIKGNAEDIFIKYDNSTTGLKSIEASDAINEIYSMLTGQSFTPRYTEVPSSEQDVKLIIDYNGGHNIDSSTLLDISGTSNSTIDLNEDTYRPYSSQYYNITLDVNNQQVTTDEELLREPKKFDRWNLSGGGSINNETNIYTFGSSNATLTAQWKDISIEFSLPQIYKEGYACKWAEDSIDGPKYDNNSRIQISKDTTYYVVCEVGQEQQSQQTITLNPNGGTLQTARVEVTKGTQSLAIINPTREGYSFAGWYLSTEGNDSKLINTDGTFVTGISSSQYVDSQGKWIGSSDITLYAHWNANTYNITYQLNGGTNYSTAPTSYTYGTGVIINGTPTKEGYTFNGWKNVTDNVGWSKVIELSKTATGNKTIEAKWCNNCSNVSNGSCNLNSSVAGTCTYTTSCNQGYTISGNGTYNPTCTSVKKYTVTFNSNGGSSISSQTINEGNKLVRPSDPTKNGYDFAGWFKEKEFKNEWNFLNDKVNSNITLYAKWIKKSESTPPKDDPGSSGGGGTNSNDTPGSSGESGTNSNDGPGSSGESGTNSNDGPGLSGESGTNSNDEIGTSNISKKRVDITNHYLADEEKIKEIKEKYFKDAKEVYYYEYILKDENGNEISKEGIKIEYIVPIPSNYNYGDNLYVYEIINGEKKQLEYKIIDEHIVFTISSGGNFAIVIYPKKQIFSNGNSENSIFVDEDLSNQIDDFIIENVSEKEKKKIKKKYFKDAEDIYVVDINLYGKNRNKIDLKNQVVTYKIKLPKGFSENDNIKIFNIENGTKEEMDFIIKDGYIYIKSSSTGRFVIEKVGDTSTIANDKKKVTIAIVIVVTSIIVVAGIVITVLIIGRRNKEVS